MNFEFREESGLEFTGNWFIDSGILGFVRLLEDIYGIDLQEIREIARRKEILYFGLFPFAYICSEINRKATDHSRVPKDLINEFRVELLNSDWESGEEVFEFTWNNYVTRAAMKVWADRKVESVLFKKKGVDELPPDLKNSVTSIKKDIDELEKKLVEKHAEDLREILGRRFKGFKFEDIDKILSATDDDLQEFSEELSYSFKEYRDCLLNLMGLFEEKWKRDVVGKERIPEDLGKFYRLPIDNKFYKNFLFFNYSATHQKQKENLLDIISSRVEDLDVLKNMDKTINKFLTSYKEARNTYYAPLTSKHLKNFSGYLFVYLISFDRAFEFFNRMGYVLFYSNDLDITYRVNRKLRIRKSKIEDQSVLLRVTWQEIIDSLIELKSEWALENMYIIKYRDVNSQNQRFVDVEYIGISKIHAAIILDDVIRESVNYTLQVGKSEYVWLLEHLIENKPLKPLVMRHLVMRASSRTGQMSIKPLIYALAIDSEVFSGLNPRVFEDPLEISQRMEEVVFRIKEAYGEMNLARRNVMDLIPRGTRENALNHLLSIMRRNNRYLFVNTLLKILIQENEAFHRLKDYLFNRILQNDETWDIYAAALLTGFLGGR